MCSLLSRSAGLIKPLLSTGLAFSRSFHVLNTFKPLIGPIFLQPRNGCMALVPNCGLKTKGVLKRRCKDCYLVKRQNLWYVMCKTHPRHKQVQMHKKESRTWILSHATQSKYREW